LVISQYQERWNEKEFEQVFDDKVIVDNFDDYD
jgi:hypothetical protein